MMNYLFKTFLILISFSAFSFSDSNQVMDCHDSSVNSRCLLFIGDVFPTQFNIGQIVTHRRVERIHHHNQRGRLDAYLAARVAPLVWGPGNRFFIIDRHHLSYALLNSQLAVEKKYLRAYIKKDWRHFSEDTFWKKMQNHQWAYLKDKGSKRHWSELPPLDQLGDDPHRSLIWLAIRRDVIDKPNDARPFFEFYIADQIREHIHLNGAQTFEDLEVFLPKLERHL